MAPTIQERCGWTGDGLKEATKIFKGLEIQSKLGLFSSLQNSSNYRVTTKRVEALREPMEKVRDNRHELYQKRIHPGIKNKFFTLEQPPLECCRAPVTGTSQRWLGRVLNNPV